MQEKSLKKAKKREKQASSEMAANTKPAKQPKLHNGVQEKVVQQDDVDGDRANDNVSSPAKGKGPKMPVDTSIFAYFKALTDEQEEKRMEATLQLLQYLSRTKRQSELDYTLKRLIRGCGASSNVSRTGFYTALVTLLKSFGMTEVSFEQVLQTMQKELNVGATLANKEDASAIVGRVITCGALLQAGYLANVDDNHLEQLTSTLLQATQHRYYHCSLAYSYVIALLERLTHQQFESIVWPLLRKELIKPWPKQSLQTVHCLIVAQQRFPNTINTKFLKMHFGGNELLNAESAPHLLKIFWEHNNANVLTHPGLEAFGICIASNAQLSKFWAGTVDAALQTPTKLVELETLKIATDILNNLQSTTQTQVVDLLSANFMRMFMDGLRARKQRKDETVKAFYDEFLTALLTRCEQLPQDAQKVAVIRRLILPPGAFDIEKHAGTRIVHQLINSLGAEGVQDIYEVYKSIFIGAMKKQADAEWTHFERLNAGYMLQHLLTHKAVQTGGEDIYRWREEQLRFLLTCGIFYVNGALEICQKDAAGSFSKEYGEQCKNMFYASVQSKLGDLQQEEQLLHKLVTHCQRQVEQKHAAKCCRLRSINAALQQSWSIMYEAVGKADYTKHSKVAGKQQTQEKLQLVFRILLLNMGLQLFAEQDMAAAAIEDLVKCMERIQQQNGKKLPKLKTKLKATQEEPEWIEVLMDLFLHFLSHNSSALRSTVKALFPHFCDNLNLSSVHQMLAMLEMKDGQNPLSVQGEEEEDDEDEDEDAEGEQKDDDAAVDEAASDDDDEEEEEADEDDDDDESDDTDEEDEEEDDEEDEEVSAADKLRNAISQALMGNGKADAHANNNDDDDDVDLNEMTEEEGRRLDEALANAFKALKRTAGSGSGAHSKKSKSYRIQTTATMHFRIRVLDLVELYVQQTPTLHCAMEIMLALFNMLEYCIGEELRPLQQKVEKVLCKLTALKTACRVDAELEERNFVEFLRMVVEKKVPAAALELTNRMRNKCVTFLISGACRVAAGASVGGGAVVEGGECSKVLALCVEYVEEFVKTRNPAANITLLSEIFKMRWTGVWQLAYKLTQLGYNMQTRTFRRLQANEILAVLYRNNELQKLDETRTRKELTKIEALLQAHIERLAAGDAPKQSLKEFQTLLELLLQAQKTHARLQLESVLSKAETCEAVQSIRRQLRLESAQVYQRYCGVHKLKVIRNSEVQAEAEAEDKQNGSAMLVDDNDAAPQFAAAAAAAGNKKKNAKTRTKLAGEMTAMTQGGVATATLPKSKQNITSATTTSTSSLDARKLKKQKKQQRMLAASRGLNGGFGFATTAPDAADSDGT